MIWAIKQLGPKAVSRTVHTLIKKLDDDPDDFRRAEAAEMLDSFVDLDNEVIPALIKGLSKDKSTYVQSKILHSFLNRARGPDPSQAVPVPALKEFLKQATDINVRILAAEIIVLSGLDPGTKEIEDILEKLRREKEELENKIKTGKEEMEKTKVPPA